MRRTGRKFFARIFAALSAVLVLGAVSLAPAYAQTYPAQRIRLLIGYPPGGPVDFLGRLIADRLSKEFGQSVTVENLPGASGTIALAELARAKPDGYTIEMVPSPAITISPHLQDVPFKPTEDFTPISTFVVGPQVLVARKDFPANSIAELVALAKTKPGVLSYGSAGEGSSNQLSAELLKSKAGIDILHVPYSGVAPALTDVMGSYIDMMFLSISEARGPVLNGTVKGIAISSLQRNQSMPNLPTIAESGLPGFESVVWHAVMGPPKLPEPILARLNASIRKMATDPQLATILVERGFDVIPSTPQELGTRIAVENKQWAELLTKLKLKK